MLGAAYHAPMRPLLLALLCALPLPAGDPPDAAAVHALVAQLGADDPAARDRAFAALVAMGDPVSGLIRAELAGEAGKDAEVQARGKECLEKIAANLKLKKMWERDPQKDLDAWIAERTCGTCGNKAPWKVWPLKHDQLRDSLPRARVYVMDWTCCQDRPVESVFLAVCRDPDAVFEIHGPADLDRLGACAMPIRSANDFELVVSSLFGILSDLPWDGPLGYQPTPIAVKTEKGHFVTHEPNSLLYADWDPEVQKLHVEKRPIR